MNYIIIGVIAAFFIFSFLNNIVNSVTNSNGYQPTNYEDEEDKKNIIPPSGGTGEKKLGV